MAERITARAAGRLDERLDAGGSPAEGAPAEDAPAEDAPAEGAPAKGAPDEGDFDDLMSSVADVDANVAFAEILLRCLG